VSGELERPVERPVLADRGRVLELLAQHVAGAWASFDAPRPEEPPVTPDLEAQFTGPLPEIGEPPEGPLAEAAHVLDASVSPARPLYLAYIGSTGLEVGVLAAALMATYDVNLAVSGRGADLVERQTLAWLGEFLGFPLADGVFTSGGMTSNLTALLAARERALPGSRRDGVGGQPAGVYCSDEAHHSVVRAVEAIGLGAASVRRLPLDDARRLRPADLDAAIAQDRADGVVPVAVVANGGTTLTGAVDPLDATADVCERHGVWLHVDGAYGLAAAAVPSTAPLFRGLHRAHSVTLDAHKWLGVQKSCSVALVREPGALHAAFGHRERYMLHRDDEPHWVDQTLEYSRPFRSLKLWLAFRTHGAAAFRIWIEHTLALTRRFADHVRDSDAFELLHEPQLSTVCFRHRHVDNAQLAHAAQDDGRVFLAPAAVDDRVGLRVTFVNFRTQPQDVDAILPVLSDLADRTA
jgi:aromatic-L-amino-acid/L-tryptophan decarboxylase